MSGDVKTGRCLCGAVAFETTGDPLWVANCHCSDCRRASGGPMVTYAGFADDAVAFTRGEPKSYASSPGVVRQFCQDCGTSLTYRSERWPGEIHVLVAAFDEPAAFSPEGHVYTAEQVPWLSFDDGLPRHNTVPSDSDGDG